MAKIVFELDFGVAIGNGTDKIGIQAHPAVGLNLTGGDVIVGKIKNIFAAITTGAKTLFHITAIDKKEADAIEMKNNVEEASDHQDSVMPKKSRRKKKPIEETKLDDHEIIDYREVITES